MASVKLEDIKYEKISAASNDAHGQEMLVGEIPGAGVSFHTLSKGEKRDFIGGAGFIRVLFLCQGGATFSGRSGAFSYDGRAVYTDMPGEDISVFAPDGCEVLD